MNIKCIFILVIAIIPLFANGQNYFKDGIKWRTLVSGTHDPEGNSAIETVTLEKAFEGNCFEMYRTCEDNKYPKKFIALIKVESSKVFFTPNHSDATEWYLLYDFGLETGEGCYVYDPVTVTEDGRPYRTYVKSIGLQENDDNEDWPLMMLQEYIDDSCSEMIGFGSWIKGLSSVNGVLRNNRFELDGLSSILIEAAEADKIIYSNQQISGLEMVNSANLEIKVIDLNIYVSTNGETKGSVYSQNGLHIGDYVFSHNPTRIQVCGRGIYFIRCGEFSKKTLVL